MSSLERDTIYLCYTHSLKRRPPRSATPHTRRRSRITIWVVVLFYPDVFSENNGMLVDCLLPLKLLNCNVLNVNIVVACKLSSVYPRPTIDICPPQEYSRFLRIVLSICTAFNAQSMPLQVYMSLNCKKEGRLE